MSDLVGLFLGGQALPINPDELLKHPEWTETTHPEAGILRMLTKFEKCQGGALQFEPGKAGAGPPKKRSVFLGQAVAAELKKFSDAGGSQIQWLPDAGRFTFCERSQYKNGYKTFENKNTGEKLRHDKGKSWTTGHKAHDRYHRPNPNTIGKNDEYLGGQGNPTRDQNGPFHIYSPEGVNACGGSSSGYMDVPSNETAPVKQEVNINVYL